MTDTIKTRAKHITLANFISGRFLTDNGWVTDDSADLDDTDKAELMALFGKRCQSRNKMRLEYALDNIKMVGGFGILDRVQYDSRYGWSYCAGQSYPDEIRTVRECLIKNFS